MRREREEEFTADIRGCAAPERLKGLQKSVCFASIEADNFCSTMKSFTKKMSVAALLAAWVSVSPLASAAAETKSQPVITQPVESKAERDARMAWWREAKFGMFIHWGVYAALAGSHNGKQTGGAGEWILYDMEIPVADYKAYSEKFNPVNYTPEQWVIMAKKAGMKYIVITSKHHDGFALFDTKVSNWDVVDATPYGKDLIAPLAEACHKHGMKFGFYYSQAQDWTHPGGGAYKNKWDDAQKGDFAKYVNEIAIPQTREILSNYDKIDIIWWNTPANMTPELTEPLFKLAHELQPGIIMNDRLDGGFHGDSATPEQHIPTTGYADGRDWEVCMTLNNTWGYSAHDQNWKSPERVIKNLVDIASKGGNYLINMGPMADGSVPEATVECFREVGNWMHINGESIYNTTASPFKKLSWGRCTKRLESDGVRLYLHVFDWPEDGTLLLPGLRNDVLSANLLWEPVPVGTQIDDSGVWVKVPGRPPGNLERPEVISLKLKGVLNVESIPLVFDGSKDFEFAASEAELTGKVIVEQKAGKDNIGYWTDSKDSFSWSFKLKNTGKFELFSSVASQGDTTIEVVVGDMVSPVKIKSTGSYDKFGEPISLGVFEFKADQTIQLLIRSADAAWSPVNIRDIKAKKLE